jgi:hypothetical protein
MMMLGKLTVLPVLYGLALEVMTVNRFEMQCVAMDTLVDADNHSQE